ncbi:MAG TPA: DUF4097 family beta strand repeat-containing protein [Fulvivirga sp.]|nr:DUF4097 family beta strand repeat-containing protein [Fulvivirga sp.]
MKNIKILGLAILMLTGTTLVKAQDKGEMLIPFSNPGSKGSLRVDVKRGSITVKGTDRKDILIKYEAMESKHKDKNKGSDSKDGLKRISSGSVDLVAAEENNRASVSSDSWNKGLNLTVEVPKTIDLNLDTYNGGDIYVENIVGEVILENYNGEIKAKGITGSVSADTYNGEITVELLKVTPNTPMSFTTYNGDVDITFPAGFKAELKLKTNQGEIYSGFEMEVIKSEPIKKTDSKSGTYKVYLDDWVRGKINGGGPEVVMKNYNGDIYIRRQ